MMLRGSLGAVAAAALSGGSEALAGFGLEVGRPVRPMLAASAPTIEEALAKVGRHRRRVEWKLDGIRIQVHRSEGDVRLFTRTLDDITARLPEVVAVLAELPVSSAVLDGELIALREDGRPLPFQDTAARTASLRGRFGAAVAVPVRRPAPGGRRPDRLRRPGAARRPGPGGAGRAAHAPAGDRLGRRGHGVLHRRAGARARGRRGQVAARRRTRPGGGAPGGSRSSRGTRSTWWCWPSSGATGGAAAGCPTCTWAPATRPPAASSCSARRSRA